MDYKNVVKLFRDWFLFQLYWMALLSKRRHHAEDILKYCNCSTQLKIWVQVDFSRRVCHCRIVTCHWGIVLYTLWASWVHMVLCGHLARQGHCPASQELDGVQLPVDTLLRYGRADSCQPGSASASALLLLLLLLCLSLPLPDRRILQQRNAQEKIAFILCSLFVDLGHSDLAESRLRELFAVPSQTSKVYTIILHNTEEQEQQETSTAAW